MRFTDGGIKMVYKPKYYVVEDKFKIRYPRYIINHRGKIFYHNEWYDITFYFHKDFYGNTILTGQVFEIPDSTFEIKISYLNRLRIRAKYLLLKFEIYFLRLKDRALSIKTNLHWILVAALGALLYYLINYLFDNYLMRLINESNLAQSIIVFLSLSSIINIFHPFNLKKEITSEDINNLIDKKQNDNEFQKYRDKNFRRNSRL